MSPSPNDIRESVSTLARYTVYGVNGGVADGNCVDFSRNVSTFPRENTCKTRKFIPFCVPFVGSVAASR